MNILMTGAFPQAQEIIPTIRELGHQVVFMQHEQEALPCDPTWVEGIIGNGIFLTHAIEQFVNLRYIQVASAGLDRVPMRYVEEHGIQIRNARGVYSIPMAEFALCGVLQLYKQAAFFRKNQEQHAWVKHRGLVELYGKHVCIVGCGSVGTECARRFQAMGCRVTGVDLLPRQDANFDPMHGLDALNEVLPEADILLLTLPLTDRSRHMIDAGKLARLRPDAILVNVARGALIVQDALIDALENRRIAGAVLDVFEDEPLTDSRLWDMEQVIVTPHNSFAGERNAQRLRDVTLTNLRQLSQP